MSQIVNKVKNSGIISFDIEEHLHPLDWKELDIKDQLFHGLAIKEKDFRSWIDSCDWSQYEGKGVAFYCSADVIIPNWAFMLLASKLEGVAVFFGQGSLVDVKNLYVFDQISKLNIDDFLDSRVVIKGCSDGDVPSFVYSELVRVLKPHVKSIMFGEPCSTVPVYKKPRL